MVTDLEDRILKLRQEANEAKTQELEAKKETLKLQTKNSNLEEENLRLKEENLRNTICCTLRQTSKVVRFH